MPYGSPIVCDLVLEEVGRDWNFKSHSKLIMSINGGGLSHRFQDL